MMITKLLALNQNDTCVVWNVKEKESNRNQILILTLHCRLASAQHEYICLIMLLVPSHKFRIF